MENRRPDEVDKLRDWFAGLPDETLPFHLNEKVMDKVHLIASVREKRNKRREIAGYITGGVVMLTACVLILAYMGVSFEIPSFDPSVWSFPALDFGMFKSQSFLISLHIGGLALILLISDFFIRRHIENHKK
jgi:hypothetical protein